MRILLVNGAYPPHLEGGAEVVSHGIDAGLVARGHQVHVVATCRGCLAEAPRRVTRVTWVRRPAMSFPPLDLVLDHYVSPVAMARCILRVLDEEAIDVIHATNAMAAWPMLASFRSETIQTTTWATPSSC